ncbi:PREDICTED: transmembrane protease serine 11E-like [Thamnophis sirtalis]|uniref:Transmembrane protease serine 11E-like n=1 Tax=Thamnophis sirtalis TaxID=35019 RepID=A0A6I9XRS5_9SAUR|nr:PREDICTED: transmembrane protease serine 11E-like [Thamnophis sirtalis]
MGLSEGRKMNMFLGYCGSEVFETAKDLSEPTPLQSVAWPMLQQTLRIHYAPKPSKHVHQHEFNIHNQKEGESINEYVAALRKAAAYCNFRDLDELILDRIICGDEGWGNIAIAKLIFVIFTFFSEINEKNGTNLLNSCCGTRLDRSVERIYGGTIAGEGEWPWQASLQLNGIHRCGATLISNNWLVTAAHCFRGVRDVRSWTSSFGARLRPPRMRRNLREIIIHEHYANNVMNHEFDIAVVQLSSPVEFTTDVHRVCLPEASYIFPENTTCAVTGFGALKDDGPSVGELRQTEVKIISNQVCNRRQVYNGAISSGMLCAGYLEGGSDACQGDSGGPLVTSDSRGIWYLVGIVSWGDECAKPNKPGVYTRVTYYRSWIAYHTGI